MTCPACTAEMPETDAFCEECGVALAPAANGCPKCGAAKDDEGFCAACGFRDITPAQDRIAIEISSHFAGVTDRGRRHSSNEDFLVLSETARHRVMVVCDGVSSSQDAMLASKAAAEAAASSIAAGRSMQQAVADALAAVVKLPAPLTDTDPPSTTLVAARIKGARVEIAWAGDSRAYWISAGGSRQLTVDDSWLNDMIASGQMSTKEAMASKNAHAITKWLGRDVGELEASFLEFEMPGPGVLLLCSDGLWNYAQQLKDIEDLLGTPTQALSTAHKLVDYANARGGVDNITAALWINQ